MNDYNKNYFWTAKDALNRVHFYFQINGEMIEVSKEVYLTCYNSYRRAVAEKKRRREINLMSLDAITLEGSPFLDFLSSGSNLHNEIIDKIMFERVDYQIKKLKERDRKIIIECILNDRSESDLAKELGVTQQAIAKRKKQIIEELRKKLK